MIIRGVYVPRKGRKIVPKKGAYVLRRGVSEAIGMVRSCVCVCVCDRELNGLLRFQYGKVVGKSKNLHKAKRKRGAQKATCGRKNEEGQRTSTNMQVHMHMYVSF